MGRKAKSKELNLWMNGEPVGLWRITASGIHEFSYMQSWIDSDYSRAISLSLPLRPAEQKYRGTIVESYFENLLPDSLDIRKRIQSRFHTRTTRAFDLLEEIGRDCVGAIQLLPPDIDTVDVLNVSGQDVSESEIENILLSVTGKSSNYNFNEEDFRISIAGAQEKTTFLFYNKKWKIPGGSTPSTHIFKLPIGPLQSIDMSTSVYNEWLCSKIINAFNVSIANSDIAKFGEQHVLVVKRFDRKNSHDSRWIIRIPQEDFCQATGTSPGLKYESDGGPGINDIMDILLGSTDPETDRNTFFKSQILFWLLAVPDGHGKNFSIFLEQNSKFSLTPLYDVMSAYPAMGKSKNEIPPQKLKMAMALHGKNKHYNWQKIRNSHWIKTGKKCGLAEKSVNEILDEIIECTPEVISHVTGILPEDFDSRVADSIFQGMKESVENMK